jgi:predicted restriction endonuclease
MCHIEGRGQQGPDTPENIIVLCRVHHYALDNGTEAEREALRDEYKRVTEGK